MTRNLTSRRKSFSVQSHLAWFEVILCRLTTQTVTIKFQLFLGKNGLQTNKVTLRVTINLIYFMISNFLYSIINYCVITERTTHNENIIKNKKKTMYKIYFLISETLDRKQAGVFDYL